MTQDNTQQLSRLKTPSAYQAEREHVFPSKSSLQWFIRTRRQELISAKALLMLGGRLMIDSEAFDAAVLDAGHKAMSESAE